MISMMNKTLWPWSQMINGSSTHVLSQDFSVPQWASGHKAAPELSRCANPTSYDLLECPHFCLHHTAYLIPTTTAFLFLEEMKHLPFLTTFLPLIRTDSSTEMQITCGIVINSSYSLLCYHLSNTSQVGRLSLIKKIVKERVLLYSFEYKTIHSFLYI
jgi:hypothetical protein